MRITRQQLREIIKESIGHEGFQEKALAAAQYAVKKVGYPQGGLIENEIHHYLETEYGMDPNGDEIWSVADEALTIAGNLLGVGDTL